MGLTINQRSQRRGLQDPSGVFEETESQSPREGGDCTQPLLPAPTIHTSSFPSCALSFTGGGGVSPAGPGSAHLGETSDGAPGAWEKRAPSSPDPWLCTRIAAPPPSPRLVADHQFPAGASRESLSGPPRLPSTARAGTVTGSTGVRGGCSSPPTIWAPSRATDLGALEAVCTTGLVPAGE